MSALDDARAVLVSAYDDAERLDWRAVILRDALAALVAECERTPKWWLTESVKDLQEARGLTSDEPKELIDGVIDTLGKILDGAP